MSGAGPRRSRAEDAPVDAGTASRLLAQAEKHVASAAIQGIDSDSRFAMLYDAARKSADAILRVNGRRVSKGVGHHIAYFEEAKRLVGVEHAALWTRVQVARSTRNDMEYGAREVTEVELADLADATATLVLIARAHVEGATPPPSRD